MNESQLRSATKTVTWRITGSTSTLLISYVATGSIAAAGSIAGVQVVVNMILYYFHERAWTKIVWKNKE